MVAWTISSFVTSSRVISRVAHSLEMKIAGKLMWRTNENIEKRLNNTDPATWPLVTRPKPQSFGADH